MILSDVLHSTVLSDEGMKLGIVIDVRFVVDGAPGPLLADARLSGLIISPRSGSSFLGYERLDTNKPWLIAQLLRRRHRGAFLIEWEDFARFDDGVVHLRTGYRLVSPALDTP